MKRNKRPSAMMAMMAMMAILAGHSAFSSARINQYEPKTFPLVTPNRAAPQHIQEQTMIAADAKRLRKNAVRAARLAA